MKQPELETGTVLSTDGISATVVTNKSRACNECGKAEAGICGKQGAGIVMKAKNSPGAKTGDRVVIELEKSAQVKAYFLAFIFPVMALCVCAYFGYILSVQTGTGGLDVISGLTGFIVALLISLKMIHSLDKSAQMYISRIIHESPDYTSGSCSEEADYLNAFNREG